MLPQLYAQHIARLAERYADGLDQHQGDAILLHSGSTAYYHADDREISFQAYGHFLHWIPVNRPDQFLLIKPGYKPVYYQVVPTDLWYEQDIPTDPMWLDVFDIVRVDSVAAVKKALADSTLLFLGENLKMASQMGIEESRTNPRGLISYLDYHRAYKSDYEIEQLREANRLALNGHTAARDCFLAGGSEYDVHLAYLGACKLLENETPYTNIVAINEKSAILHYQNKRRGNGSDNRVLLIDAGYRVRGYGADITRTTGSNSASTLFMSLLQGMEALELKLIDHIRAGDSYIDIHLAALRWLGELLLELEICNGAVDVDELLDLQIPQLFMPHGVGHLLGINVHDTGGWQQDERGTMLAPPSHSPGLRNTRTMEENMVFTIEPGCYFIPVLLEPERHQARGKHINWSAVDALYSHGGIRVEDNVRVTATAAENLTRQRSY